MSVFGVRIKHLRELRGVTQEDIANLLGVSRATVSKYESGHRKPDIDTIKALARYFGVTTDYLFGLTNDSDRSQQIGDGTESYVARVQARGLAKEKAHGDMEKIENLMRSSHFIRLAEKIIKNNLDISIIEEIINNIILLKNQKSQL